MKLLVGLALFFSASLFANTSQDLSIIRQRFLTEIMNLVPQDQVADWRKTDFETWFDKLQKDGHFKDFDYKATTNYAWGPAHHMSVAFNISLAYKTKGHPFYQDPKIKEKILLIVRYATEREWDHINWWHKEIGLPLTLYKFLFLMGDELPRQDVDWMMKAVRKGHIVDHPSNWPANGQNAVWYAETTLALAVLFNQPQWLNDARNAMGLELEVGRKQGIQVDQSFYQHGRLFYNGGYGLGFSLDMARFFERLSGTKYSFTPKQYKAFTDYLLDGQLWLIHGKTMEPGSKGREYARKGAATSLRFQPACVTMSRVVGPRQKEFAQCAENLKDQKYMGKYGNKFFFRGDFVAHNRKNFAISIKMHSERTLSGDRSPLYEGLKSHHQSDGVSYIFRDGSEYYDISPIWDFNRWPGITIDYTKEYPLVPDFNYWPNRGLTDFVGAVSDGTYGAATMDFKYRLLVAKKSWFFHDDVMVALGSGISGFDWQNTTTSINQEWSTGPIIYGEQKLETGKADIGEGSWAHANNVGYELIRGKRFHLQNDIQKGTWKSLANQLSDAEVEGKVTSLWIEHDKGPHVDTYAYAVYPAVDLESFKSKREAPQYSILANTSAVQAVKFLDNQYQVIFHEKGEVKLEPKLILKVDKPVALLIRKNKSGYDVSVSSPDQKVSWVNVQLGTRKAKFTLPVEQMAGSSTKKKL